MTPTTLTGLPEKNLPKPEEEVKDKGLGQSRREGLPLMGWRPESEEECLSMARRHWKKHRPKLCQELEKDGVLEDHLQSAAKSTWEAMARIEKQLIQENGYTQQQAKDTAWEMMRGEWVLVPGEDDDEDE